MAKTQEDLYIMQLSYYFLSQRGYRLVISTDARDGEFWLCNPQNNEYPMIRVSNEKFYNTNDDIGRLLKIRGQIVQYTRKRGSLLDIYVDGEAPISEHPDIEFLVLKEGYISNRLIEEHFVGINQVLQHSENPEEDYEKVKDNILLLKEGFNQIRGMGGRPKSKEIPLVTTTVAIICLLIFLIATYLRTITREDVVLVVCGSLYKTFVYGANEWFRLLTSGFLHMDIGHFLMNMIALFNLGIPCEKIFGKRKTAIILLGSILMSSFFALISSTGSTATLGLSGGIYGLASAFLLYLYCAGLLRNKRIRNRYINIILINVFISFMPNISGAGHLGGAIGGLLFGVIFIDKPEWKILKKNSLYATIVLFGFLIFFSTTMDDKKTPIYIGTDMKVVDFLKEQGLYRYGSYIEDSLLEYYRELGVIK